MCTSVQTPDCCASEVANEVINPGIRVVATPSLMTLQVTQSNQLSSWSHLDPCHPDIKVQTFDIEVQLQYWKLFDIEYNFDIEGLNFDIEGWNEVRAFRYRRLQTLISGFHIGGHQYRKPRYPSSTSVKL